MCKILNDDQMSLVIRIRMKQSEEKRREEKKRFASTINEKSQS